MDPGKFARTRLFLCRRFRNKIILNPSHCEQLRVVEVANHPVVLEILKKKGQPFCGI